jgi:hypothetical protein
MFLDFFEGFLQPRGEAAMLTEFGAENSHQHKPAAEIGLGDAYLQKPTLAGNLIQMLHGTSQFIESF